MLFYFFIIKIIIINDFQKVIELIMFYFRTKYYCLTITMLVSTCVLQITTVFVTVTTTYHFKMLLINFIELYMIYLNIKPMTPVSISVIEKLQSWNLLVRYGVGIKM